MTKDAGSGTAFSVMLIEMPPFAGVLPMVGAV